MRFGLYTNDSGFQAAFSHALQVWCACRPAQVELAVWPDWESVRLHWAASGCALLFADMDQEPAPLGRMLARPLSGCPLLVCSDNPRTAIDCYALRPAGFLRRRLSPERLEKALNNCLPLWSDGLTWLEVSAGRSRVRLPLCELVWAEAAGRRCVLHSAQGPIDAGESLMDLAGRLPEGVFLRCQKSFLINLRHAVGAGRSFLMSDGAEVPISRSVRAEAAEALSAFQARWTAEEGISDDGAFHCRL